VRALCEVGDEGPRRLSRQSGRSIVPRGILTDPDPGAPMGGRRLPHFEILGKLGEGGMAVVYQARDTHLDLLVAIKVRPTGAPGRFVVGDCTRGCAIWRSADPVVESRVRGMGLHRKARLTDGAEEVRMGRLEDADPAPE